MRTPPDDLDPLLERWRGAVPPLDPSVGPEVRRRLRAAPGTPARPGWLAALEEAFARPSFAAAFVTACVLFGLFLAEMRLTRLHAERNAQLARSYLRLVDPLLENPPPAGITTEARR